MKRFISILCVLLAAVAPLRAVSDTFIDYQNYNHGYCPDCNCYPCRCAETPDDPDAPIPPPPGPGQAPCAQGTCPACKKPDPCCPAPVCATNCGISLVLIGIAIAGVAAAGIIIINTDNGR